MKKLLTNIAGILITGSLFAGGVVTNTNQSASWVRLPARDASTGIDAVYFNPAGLMKLENGFHFSISNQTISQNKTVENFYKLPGNVYGLNKSLYKGKVSAPVFPGVYAAWKNDKLSFSFGFNPIGGGGGATFKRGLPSFEMSPSDLVPALASEGYTDYRLFTFFEGTSVFFGYQGGVSYKINDIISVGAGLRYVSAKNTYKGYLRNLELLKGVVWERATDAFTGVAAKLTSIKAIPASLPVQQAGGYTLAQLVAAKLMTAAQKTGIETALKTIGVAETELPNMTVLQISNTITGAGPQIDAKIAKATATAALVVDQEADVEQTGSGITPFFSINISPAENINIGLKYELKTKLGLKNKTAKDFITGFTTTGIPVTMFPNGEKIRNDMPAMFSAGIDYGIIPSLRVSAGFHYFFDKGANYGHKLAGVYVDNDMIFDNNYYELAGGLQYNINEKLLISGGYLYSKTGVNDDYQSDLTYSLTSTTVGFGGGYNLTNKMMINLGFSYTMYKDGEKTVQHLFAPTETIIPAKEVYTKDTMIIAVGLDFSF